MIVNSVLVLVSNQGNRSYVIEDHYNDDGRIYRVEGLRDNKEDFTKSMQNRVPEVEAELAAEDVALAESVNAASATVKIETYLDSLDLKTVAGLTDEELAAITP